MSFIYLASPYSNPAQAVVEARFVAVCEAAARLMAAGHKIFSPIAHTHPIAQHGQLPTDWKFWRDYDEAMICAADRLWILTLPGWRESKGVSGEILIALREQLPIAFVDPETLEVTR